MSEALMIAFIGSIPATAAAIGAIVIGLKNHQQITVVLKATNGLLRDRDAQTKETAHAEGHAAGMAAQRKLDNPP